MADLELALGEGVQWPWRGPFNGQHGRQDLVRWIAQQIEFTYAIETGTWRGSSTCFLADVLGCPVWTVEYNPSAYRYTARIFARRDDVHTALGDSRDFLRTFESADRDGATFLYLDSHWDRRDLPLWEEIQIIFERWASPVVMIDDFQVPCDPGYRYDDYGDGKSLVYEDLSPHLPPETTVLFPSLASAEETGPRRGCCVIARSDLGERLRGSVLNDHTPEP